jgi:iron complex outermembrane recepter protein
MNRTRSWTSFVVLCALQGVQGVAVQAAESSAAPASGSASSGGLDDVIVTAQRRTEDVQKAALSISAYSGDLLRDQGISRPDDLTRVASGVQISGGTTTQVYVRGVGDFGVTATANPAVATSLDGVAIARPQAIAGNFFDLERIELLKGPQGTLYGRNASGGALNILATEPKLGETSGYAEVNLGNYSQKGVEGAFNLAAGSENAFRVSYQLNDRAGYLSDGTDDDKHQSFRLQHKYDADGLSVRTLLGYAHLGGEGSGLVVVNGLPGLSPWTGNTDPVAGAAYLQAAANQFNGALQGGCNPAPTGNCPPPPALLADPSTTHPFQDITTYNASLEINKTFDFATLTVIPGWRETHSRFTAQPSFLYNVGGVYDAAGDRSNGETSNQTSLEVRLAHDADRLKWVIGGYGFRENQTDDYSLYGGLIQNQRLSGALQTKAYAAFGQLTYSLTDAMRLTGGLRYTSDQRSADDLHVWAISPAVTAPSPSTGQLPLPCLPNVPVPGATLPGTLCPLLNASPGYYDSSTTFTKVTWKAGVEVDLAPQSMLYADVSTGFKAGGFNQAVSLTDPTKLQPYDPESITAYSLGIKNRFLNNRLQVNAEAFYWNYKNLQLSSQAIDGAGLIVLLTQNAGQATVKGLDVDLVAKPWEGGSVHAAVEYVNSNYNSFVLTEQAEFVPPGRVNCPVTAPNEQGLVTVDCSGKPLVRSPEWSGNLGITQSMDLAGGGTVSLGADLAFASGSYQTTDFIAAEQTGSWTNLSTSLTYNAPHDAWYVSAYGRNLTNQVIYTGGGGHQAAFVSGWVTSSIAPPRTFGVRLGVRF